MLSIAKTAVIPYVDKNGKEKAYENFALEVGGYRIFIKPSFKQSYYLLSILAEPTTISDGDKK